MSRPGSESIQASTKFRLSPYRDTSTMLLEFTVSLSPYTRVWNIFCEPTGKNSKIHYSEKPYDYSDWTGSMACVRTWLAECLENHSDCPASRLSERTLSKAVHPIVGRTTYLPTRLVKIGEPEATKVRLRLSHELDGTSSQYATLSHCWGKSKTLRLTSTSFQRFRDGVAISDLAKTFQDAISTAQSLGIELLWIDSFCIFQDSKEDWEKEAGLMSQVYRHSFLNIAASGAVDSDAGFFRERASTIEPYVVQTAWTDHPNGTYHVYSEDYWSENFERMPLRHRAWVFQENVLAPRILHVCSTQLFWECHGLRACETWPIGLPAHMYAQSSLKSTGWPGAIEIFGSNGTAGIEPLRISTDKNAILNRDSFNSLWIKLVSEYSLCNLTFSNDKLIALSGVAKHMERLLDIEYCAGLWGHDIVQGLAWYVPRKSDLECVFPTEAVPFPYRAPSWSWACMDGRIVWQDYYPLRSQFLADVVSWDVKTATTDRTGAVTCATLQLSGFMTTMELHPEFGVEKNLDIYCDSKWISMDIHQFQFDRRPPSFQLHCMPLFIDSLGHMCAILITPTQSARGHFRRVGQFRAWVGFKNFWDWNQLPHFENESWLEYESVTDDGKYTITII
ncbi:heterokaryon incompatibility protein-domain-containing protein [Alternaria rosae]|uniref:heterokaryon incompatibility protein-domain-containing protein n=1 Tax=Alternaria rosae TaxID=1187941 RepID=UPI001E8D3687|nr:heterokaryon incompatibility protein-domain-containing protein [Alternaria rosae]KAH6851534.1 heterokaryon incompatibility protein-domain-containing protein [Alternaria rosae]